MFAHAPRNVPHTFANLTEKDARMLVLLTPAGYERFLAGEESRHQATERVASWSRTLADPPRVI